MGDVIHLPGRNKPVKADNLSDAPADYDNLGPASPQLLEDMYWLVKALGIGEVEVTRLCGYCIRSGKDDPCSDPMCGLYQG